MPTPSLLRVIFTRLRVARWSHHRWATLLIAVVVTTSVSSLRGADELPSQQVARETLRRVLQFYRSHVGYQGAYLWRYSADLTLQEGEGQATKTSGWTQPPGAPSVGEAYLTAWRLSGEEACLEAAVEVARALVRAQLVSGGWDSHFDLGPAGTARYAYRVEGEAENPHGRNYTTFDDNKSQSALMLLMHVDEALSFEDAAIHEAVEYALQKMLAAQYPNGAWPQQFDRPPDPADFPVKKASYPESWSRTYLKADYRKYYTLNDNNMSYIIDMLLEAERIYHRDDCRRAAEKTGDFFLLAQMPDPQPGWAQQYNRDMHPAWARKFEPASITGGESQSVMRTLIHLYRYTGEERFLEPLPRAIAYYRSSLLPDGRLARFYELKVNKPLYFTKDYQLTYSDDDMPTHYGFKVSSKLDSIERAYRDAREAPPGRLRPPRQVTRPVRWTPGVAQAAAKVIAALDERGAWVEVGRLRYVDSDADRVIQMETYRRNLEILARYVGAVNSN